ncbi:MAG: 2,3-bisphosphoglycerate-independent phosphoglycerate mutase [Planctomycetes bacterium]|nr:2,3-bisphosphoglycerate-independent phosphoglycerate mutase [Planctomycetota bacterium]
MSRTPVILAILDGFGEAAACPTNAITSAEPKFWNDLREVYPWTTLDCSGEDVGLPCGLMGNSEVGHLNIGAGRIVWQEISRIDRSIEEGRFFDNEALQRAVAAARAGGGKLHLIGLVSDGGVHSSDRHLFALLELAKRAGFGGDRVVVHALLDGRDTPPKSAIRYLEALETECARQDVGRIGSVCGRFYAMDRDKRWERVQRAYDMLTIGDALSAPTAIDAVQQAYARGETDEFVQPTIVGEHGRDRIEDGDAVIFFNFRTDRARELTEPFVMDDFHGFERRKRPRVEFVTMTRYRDDFPCPVAFPPSYLKGIFPEIVSRAGLTQLRIAETEKYAHVTFFFSGGDEAEFPGERRILIPSPKVRTYDEMPSMSAEAVTDALLQQLDSDECPDVVILNYANADMVGHTGSVPASIAAVKTLDHCLSRLVPKVVERGGHIAITADHGNAEQMVDLETGEPHTAHTTNPVPFLIAGPGVKGSTMKSGGRLCDIATTLLPILGLDKDPGMEGVNLL